MAGSVPSKGHQEAERLVAEARRAGATVLDLTDMGLTELRWRT